MVMKVNLRATVTVVKDNSYSDKDMMDKAHEQLLPNWCYQKSS
jgi:hypothetical protein